MTPPFQAGDLRVTTPKQDGERHLKSNATPPCPPFLRGGNRRGFASRHIASCSPISRPRERLVRDRSRHNNSRRGRRGLQRTYRDWHSTEHSLVVHCARDFPRQ